MASLREMTVIKVKDVSDGNAESGRDDSPFKHANTPITLKFEDLVYKINVRKPAESMFFLAKSSKSEEMEILRGITGMVLPREIVGVLGPSGSGKTTLLTALGGRLGGGHLEGTVMYNGKAFSSALKRATGFVTQDDRFYPHLTVAETLTYAALLRLPKTLTIPQKVAHAEAVMNQLELNKCQHNIIGDHFVRGISGGERKRVSIGQEMLLNPSLLLLDEPTSGLDSTIAVRIVRALWGLAKGGRTVMLTIHQPSSRLFYMFDKVLLLSGGNSLYFGKGRDVIDYFTSIGYSPMVSMNPADFLLDLANGVAPEADDRDEATVEETLISAYKDKLEPMLKDELHAIEDHCIDDGCEHEDYGQWPITWWQEFSILLERGVKQRKADTFSGIKIAQVLGMALLCGFLWSQSNIHGLQDKIGLLFFLSSFWGYYPMYGAIFTFPVERPMLEKERSSGMYRLSSYFLARAAGDLPMDLVLPTAFLTITYWMSGMRPNLASFVRTLVTLLYSVLACQGVGLTIGASVMDISNAATLGSVVMMSSLLAGGYYAQKVPHFIAWIQYLSTSFYTYKLLLGSQFDEHSTYPCEGGGGTCNVSEYSGIQEVGLGGQAVAAVALGIMLVGYRVVAFLVLTRVGVTKN